MEYTIDDMSNAFGEQYFDVYVYKIGEEEYVDAFMVYGSLDNVIGMMDCTLEGYDVDEITVCVDLAGYDLVYASAPGGPDDFESLVDDESKFNAVLETLAA